MLTLHYAPRTISVAVAIALEEVGTSYTATRLEFASADQTKPDYQRLNPKGRVPALETPDGVLTETGGLLEYVAPGLVPADPYAAAKMRELMCYLNGTMHPHHAHAIRGERWADEEASFADMKRKTPQRMRECAEYLEDFLPSLPFDAGGFEVVSDAYLYVVLTWLRGDSVDIAHFSRLSEFQHRMHTRPSVQAVYEKGML